MVFFLLYLFCNSVIASHVDINGKSGPIGYVHPDSIPIAKEHIEKFSHWKKRPDIKICDSAPVTVAQVKEALSWWEKRGYKFGYVFKSNCVETAHYGNIVISLAGQDFDFAGSYGTTSVRYNTTTKEIYWAQIFLVIKVRERVLEHELGHALGWHHSARKGHLLYPSWQLGGWDDDMLKVPPLNLTREHQ